MYSVLEFERSNRRNSLHAYLEYLYKKYAYFYAYSFVYLRKMDIDPVYVYTIAALNGPDIGMFKLQV